MDRKQLEDKKETAGDGAKGAKGAEGAKGGSSAATADEVPKPSPAKGSGGGAVAWL